MFQNVKLSQSQVIALGITVAIIAALYALARNSPPRRAALFYWAMGLSLLGGLCYWVGAITPDLDTAVNVLKACTALAAASAVFFEIRRAQERRPVAMRWKKLAGITLAVASIVLYFNGFKVGYQKFWHRHDQYHYFFGAKYFKELGYDELYKCTVIAEDELGKQDETIDGVKHHLDMSREVRAPEKKIRNLGGDNLLMPAADTLAHPEICDPSKQTEDGKTISAFTPPRWEEFKKDIRFFRFAAWDSKEYWDGMQKDHGYNPPPVWSLEGWAVASLHEPTQGFMQLLGLLDEFYIVAMFAGIYWAFGWRIFAVSAVLWGCQASAPNYWTLGAFLRQDWIFWLVMSQCFARKRYFKLAGASMAYTTLLRVFPGLVIIGWLVVALSYIWQHKKVHRDHLQALIGGLAATGVLVGLSLVYVGKDSYQQFYKHTIEVHNETPLTNHMGLRVMVGHRTECIIPTFPGCQVTTEDGQVDRKVSGRMQYTQNDKLPDPFEDWKTMRLQRYQKYKMLAYGIILLTFVLFAFVVRRVKTLWAGAALGQVWIVLLSQLTSYYYSFVIVAAPLTRMRRDLEIWIFTFVALTQFAWLPTRFNDDRYTILTYITYGFSIAMILAFSPKIWMFWKKPAVVGKHPPLETSEDKE